MGNIEVNFNTFLPNLSALTRYYSELLFENCEDFMGNPIVGLYEHPVVISQSKNKIKILILYESDNNASKDAKYESSSYI
ncbi:Uncharacterised protein [Candidatus Tiddalikarchaeum anstoanum]|nr:Uncharacterised protein [Candidatus Tiddalikarchaeum anstoanum]